MSTLTNPLAAQLLRRIKKSDYIPDVQDNGGVTTTACWRERRRNSILSGAEDAAQVSRVRRGSAARAVGERVLTLSPPATTLVILKEGCCHVTSND